MPLRVNILILNYNGRPLLEKYLSSFEAASKASDHHCRLGVIDNCSVDDSVEWLKKNFPSVAIYPCKVNRVLCSYNDIAKDIDDDIVIFMNNDMRVEQGFVDPMVDLFISDPQLFFVTPKCLSMETQAYEGSKTKASLKYGVFWSSSKYPGFEAHINRAGYTFQGGYGAFDRKKFLELGGYDDLYMPGRLEDSDLCFRAYKRGWKCLYEPKSIVYHEGGTSFHKKFGVKKTLAINWRNTFLFMSKNLSDKMTLLKFILWLPARIVYSLVTFKFEFLIGLFQAIPLLGKALERRRQQRALAGNNELTDSRIFDLSIRDYDAETT